MRCLRCFLQRYGFHDWSLFSVLRSVAVVSLSSHLPSPHQIRETTLTLRSSRFSFTHYILHAARPFETSVHYNPSVLDCQTDKVADTSSKVVVTTSKPGAFPSPLSLKHHSQVQALDPENIRTDAVIKETCPNCGREEVRYYTQQLRSADEGSTVFYNCECGHKYALFIQKFLGYGSANIYRWTANN